MKPLEIAAIARELLGRSYRHQGRGIAVDCAGVPVHVGQRLGMAVADVSGYGRQPVPIEMRAALDANLQRVPHKADMQVGDVVWMRFIGEPQHLGIVGDYVHGGLSLIHAHNGSGINKVVEHRLDDQWLARIVGVWRFPGVEA